MINQKNHRQVSVPPIKTFNDPDNYFSIQVPSTWNTTSSNAVEKKGLGTDHETTHTIKIINFFSSAARVGVVVQIYEETPSCNDIPNSPAMHEAVLAGLPAIFDPSRRMWILQTTNATFIITYAYPGVGGYHNPINRSGYVTPVPQAVRDADQHLVNSIISSFLPKNLQPLRCLK